MRMLLANRKAVWFALALMAANLIAPIVSRTLVWRWAASSITIEVCSVGGARQFVRATEAPASGSTGNTDPAHDVLDHCPLCTIGAERLGPASAPPIQVWIDGHPVTPEDLAFGTLQIVRPLVHRARGPPADNAFSFPLA